MFYEPWEPGTLSTRGRCITPVPSRLSLPASFSDSISWGELWGVQCAMLSGCSRGCVPAESGTRLGHGVGGQC